MFRIMAKAKIHRAAVTFTDIDYEGSISIDRDFMDRAGLLVGEKVLVIDINNGNRFDTYVIEAPRGSREIGINGGAARLVNKNDRCIILSFAMFSEEELKNYKLNVIVMNERNEIINDFTKRIQDSA